MITKASREHINRIAAIYESIHDLEEAGGASIGWIRSVYPTRETAEDAFRRGDLFVQIEDGQVVGAAVINQIQPDSYRQGKWTCHAPDDRIMVLHTLVTDPHYMRRGFGRVFVAFYEQFARKQECFLLRMDTNARNRTARQMYAGLGYTEVDIVPCDFNGIPDIRLVLLQKVLRPGSAAGADLVTE